MLYCVILILLVIFWRAKPVPRELGYFDDYMDPVYTTAIKGVFILLIFLTHGEQYLTLGDGMPDRIYSIFRMALGQSVVTAFFFYSGYGMMESLKRKGRAYLDAFPRMRILKTLLHFDLAVLLYILLGLLLHKGYSSARMVLALIGWTSVGNSAWFIFDITVAYVLFYVCFRVFAGAEDNKAVPVWMRNGALLYTAASVVFIILMILYQESRYYNTFICVSLGIWFSLYREPVERLVRGPVKADGRSGHGRFFCLLLVLAGLYVAGGVLLMGVYDRHEWLYIPLPVVFMLALLLLTMVFRFDNPVLRYFGDHLFSVFILMRLPMILIAQAGLAENVYVFFALAFPATVVLAHLFDLFLKKLDSVLFKPKVLPGAKQ